MYVWFSLTSPYTPRRDIPLAVVAMMVALLTVPACKREERAFTVNPPNARPSRGIRLSDFHPGQVPPPAHDTNGADSLRWVAEGIGPTQGRRFEISHSCLNQNLTIRLTPLERSSALERFK